MSPTPRLSPSAGGRQVLSFKVHPSGTPYDRAFGSSFKVYPSGIPYDRAFGSSFKVYPSGTPYDRAFGSSFKVYLCPSFHILG